MPFLNRRFTIEEVNNGWLLKISEAGSEKLVGRYVYTKTATLFEQLGVFLSEKPKEEQKGTK